MSNFLSGCKYIVIPHTSGVFDKEMVITIFSAIAGDIKHNQNDKTFKDSLYMHNNLKDDKKYFVVLRERIGVQSESERVRLTEFNITGRHKPAYQSEFTIWDKKAISEWKQVIRDMMLDTEDEKIVTG